MNNFQTIAIFTFQAEYMVLEHLLQQAEIQYVFLNETMLGVLPFHSNAFGGIRLQVHENDIEEAIAILKKLDSDSNLRIV